MTDNLTQLQTQLNDGLTDIDMRMTAQGENINLRIGLVEDAVRNLHSDVQTNLSNIADVVEDFDDRWYKHITKAENIARYLRDFGLGLFAFIFFLTLFIHGFNCLTRAQLSRDNMLIELSGHGSSGGTVTTDKY
jgi:cell division protein FtsX